MIHQNYWNQNFEPFFIAHPVQIAMALEKAKMIYFSMGVRRGNNEKKHQFRTLVQRIQKRIKIFNNLSADSKLAQYYRDNEAKIGAFNSLASLQASYRVCDDLLHHLEMVQDLQFFAYNYNYVPRIAFTTYRKTIKEAFSHFKSVETKCNDYYSKLTQGKATTTFIKNAYSKQQFINSNIKAELSDLKEKITKESRLIDGYTTRLPIKKIAVDDALKKFSLETFKNFQTFDPKALFDAISVLCFTLGHPASFIAALTSQSIAYTYSELTNIVNGTLQPEDPNTNKLIMLEEEFFSIIQDFYTNFTEEIKALKKIFQVYIDAITTRNNHIVMYNVLAKLIIKKHDEIVQGETQLQSLNDKILDNFNLQLPDFALFVLQVRSESRLMVMKLLDAIARSYRFWALSDEDIIYDSYGTKNNLYIVNGDTLNRAEEIILNKYIAHLENRGSNLNLFPTNQEVAGISYVINDPLQLQLLKDKDNKQPSITLDFTIDENETEKEAAEKESLGLLSNRKKRATFSGHADVRLTHVRVWVNCAKAKNGILSVVIKHLGTEHIFNKGGTPYKFDHAPVAGTFTYSLLDKKIHTDCAMGYIDKEDNAKTYALIGPFAKWEFTIKPDANPGLDLSEVSKVVVEFRGTSTRSNDL